MGEFFTRKPVPTWRLIAYGFLAAAGVAVLGVYEHDYRLYIAAVVCGVVIGAIGFGLSWARAHIVPIPGENGQPARYPRWVWWMLLAGLIGSSAVKLWDMFERK
jgi:hypothetical protein